MATREQLHRALDAAMDAAQLEVRQGRSGNYAVFKVGESIPESDWFATKSKAQEALKRLGGAAVSSKPKKETPTAPTIFGYPWEDIQALQQKKITSSQLGRKR